MVWTFQRSAHVYPHCRIVASRTTPQVVGQSGSGQDLASSLHCASVKTRNTRRDETMVVATALNERPPWMEWPRQQHLLALLASSYKQPFLPESSEKDFLGKLMR